MRNEWKASLGIALLLASGIAAADRAAVRKQAEASMLVTGSIQVDAVGKVTGFSFDQPDKLPAAVVDLLGNAVPKWRFEPVLVDGQPARVNTDMSIRIVANKLDNGDYKVGIRSAGFGDLAGRNPKVVKAPRKVAAGTCPNMAPPRYPDGAARMGVASNVYLLLKVDREGRVIDAMAEQVNMKVVSDEKSMERWRKLFADVSLAQARKWCIAPGDEELAGNEPWFVQRVPVMFHLSALPSYGKWEAYVPGPRQANPWEEDQEGPAFSPDTLLPGRAYAAGSGLKLLTKLSGS